ncbi:Ndr family [Arabidopsis thaliana x Arabidopsis arenosa]|uniref:Ndr family n=1 Tax=Arabidopsis thaliana x Arabidopsis arenosa TaxID=1240361 RepID=A0A8T1YE59_9BRAS|nr:Ndr family [Arabidopsis thaliana x Arabidopsis arenosa]
MQTTPIWTRIETEIGTENETATGREIEGEIETAIGIKTESESERETFACRDYSHDFSVFLYLHEEFLQLGAAPICPNDSAPCAKNLADQILEVLNFFGLGVVMCMGVTAGVYVLTLFALQKELDEYEKEMSLGEELQKSSQCNDTKSHRSEGSGEDYDYNKWNDVIVEEYRIGNVEEDVILTQQTVQHPGEFSRLLAECTYTSHRVPGGDNSVDRTPTVTPRQEVSRDDVIDRGIEASPSGTLNDNRLVTAPGGYNISHSGDRTPTVTPRRTCQHGLYQ